MNRPLLTAVIALTTSGVALAQQTKQNLVEVAAAAGTFETLLAAAKAAGLAETLSGKGPFTVFAPTDAAFAALGKDKIAELLLPANKRQLAAILTYHVVPANKPAAEVLAARSLPTVQGSPLAIAVVDGKVHVGDATVTATDVLASNGVIHVIDRVLMPPATPNLVEVAAAAGTFGTLLQAATAAGLADTLAKGGPFTVFAPTDAAFAALGKDTIAELLLPANKDRLATILKHHIVAGEVKAAQAVTLKEAKALDGTALTLRVDGKQLTVGGAKVVATDVMAGNGVIHVVDAVILPSD